MNLFIIITTWLLLLVLGYIIGGWQSRPKEEEWRKAEFVGMLEQKLMDSKTVATKKFYADWLQSLEDRGYMWGGLDWKRWITGK